MNKARQGFMLIEAILSVVIVSICLTFIAQSLLTNFRTGVRFQEMVRSFIVMENRLGLLYATSGSQEDLDSSSQPLDKPYEQFAVNAQADTINDHLKKVALSLSWPVEKPEGRLDMTTIIYNPNAN